jgi:hypothetical protein
LSSCIMLVLFCHRGFVGVIGRIIIGRGHTLKLTQPC